MKVVLTYENMPCILSMHMLNQSVHLACIYSLDCRQTIVGKCAKTYHFTRLSIFIFHTCHMHPKLNNVNTMLVQEISNTSKNIFFTFLNNDVYHCIIRTHDLLL